MAIDVDASRSGAPMPRPRCPMSSGLWSAQRVRGRGQSQAVCRVRDYGHCTCAGLVRAEQRAATEGQDDNRSFWKVVTKVPVSEDARAVGRAKHCVMAEALVPKDVQALVQAE